MISFLDRTDAGKQLAKLLSKYRKIEEGIVIALPRGGVIVGKEVAEYLNLPLDIVCPRKIGAPFNPEFAIGAITETGEGIFSEEYIREFAISKKELKKIIEEEKQKAKWRLDHYRKSLAPRNLEGKKVIIVDDGLATGSTMLAAIKTVRIEKAKKIIVAVPVAPPDTLEKIRSRVDDLYCLYSTPNFFAVGQFYEQFDQTTDQEVIDILNR